MKLPLRVSTCVVVATALVACSSSNGDGGDGSSGSSGTASSSSGGSGGSSGSSSSSGGRGSSSSGGSGSSSSSGTSGGSSGNGSGSSGGSGSSSGTASSSSGGSSGSSSSSGGGNVTPGCTVASTGTSGTLLSGTVLLPAGPTTGEVLISSAGSIVCAAASCSSSTGYSAATHIACPNSVISPGLINTHDHTEYATTAPQALGTTRYECRNEWRTGANGATALPDVKSTTDAPTIAAQELRFVLSGATSVIGSGGVGGLLRNLADYSNTSFLQGLTGKTVNFDTFPLGDSNGTVLASGCGYPKVESTTTAYEDGQYAPHIAEGINADAENELTCTSSAGLITSKTSVIHGVALNATDIDVVAKATAPLIWAPRSNIDLYGDTARVTTYSYEGVTIALGTDWLASGSMNMLRELNCADTFNQNYLGGFFTDAQLFAMVTSNAATAAGFSSQIGTLAAGMVADVTVFNAAVDTGYRAVIAAGDEDVQLVLRGGAPLYGDANVVSALSTTCEALTLCGMSKSVCIDVPSVTLAQIQAIGTSIYPLFFCKGTAPTSEPSCTPYRETYANGITSTDKDGDGVADTSDDCPSVFDPIRPMDGTKQADVDGDGYGDACDAQPLNPSAH